MSGTLAGAPFMGLGTSPAHRTLEVSKVENGYVVDAVFTKWIDDSGLVRPGAALLGLGHEERETQRRVFYTTPEVLAFVKDYLDAPADALRGSNPPPP